MGANVMKKILLTGGTGFIGSHTAVELIESGYNVVIADDLSNSEESVIDRIRIYSQSLVMEIMAKYDLDSGHSYTLKGKLDDVMKAVVFHLDEIYDCTRK